MVSSLPPQQLLPISSISSYCLHQLSSSLCFFYLRSLSLSHLEFDFPAAPEVVTDQWSYLKSGFGSRLFQTNEMYGEDKLNGRGILLPNERIPYAWSGWLRSHSYSSIHFDMVTISWGFLYAYSAVEHVSIQRFSKSVQHGSIRWHTTSAIHYHDRSLRGSIRYRRKGSSLFLSSGTVWSVRNQPQPFTTEMRLYSQFPPTPIGLVTPVTQQR